MINTFHIDTVLGSSLTDLPFLSPKELSEFNRLGYSGSKTDQENYLNSLGKGEFKLTRTKFDNGNFEEAFTLVWVH